MDSGCIRGCSMKVATQTRGLQAWVGIATLALLAVLGPLTTAGADDRSPTCVGSPATIYVKDGRIVGGPDDGKRYRGVLRGTAGDDVIVGSDGRDRIKGRGGRDAICGGGGDDDIEG